MPGTLPPGESNQHPPRQSERSHPRLFVFPRQDLVDATEASIDEVLRVLKQSSAETFKTEKRATQFYKQHLRTHNPPVFLSSLAEHTGSTFSGRRFSEYHTAPAGTWMGVALDGVLDDPIGCTLAEDWHFGFLEILVSQKMSHKTVGRYPDDPGRELLEALSDVEAELYEMHAVLTSGALRAFWSSVELHKHLTLQAVKMQQHQDEYSSSITQALDYVRRHVADYVAEVLSANESAERKQAPSDLSRKIRSLKADHQATVEELEDLFNLDRKTLRSIELGKPVRQSTIDKAPASRETIDYLRKQLIENRRPRRRTN